MSRLAHCVIAFLLLSLSAQAATYYECLVFVGTNGGYASFVTPDKAVNPWAGYYQAYRADIPWGPSTANYVTNSVTNNLVGWWTFETNNYGGIYAAGSTQPTFSVWAGSNDLLVSGSVWSNNNNGCYYFDGVDDFQITPDSDNWTLGSNATLSIWLKTTNQTGALISHYLSSGTFAGFELSVGQGANRMGQVSLWTGTTWTPTNDIANPAVNDNVWHLATVTLGPTGVRMYTDAVLRWVFAPQYVGDTTNSLRIGQDSNASPVRRYRGLLSSPMVIDRELNSTEVTNLYNDSCTKYGKTKL